MIGIIGAMDVEINHLLGLLRNPKQIVVADKIFYQGMMHHQEVVIVKSGIGKVNAAITTSLLLSKFNIDSVLNIGIAGGLNRAHVGEIIIANKICYSDVSLETIDDVPYGQMSNEPFFAEADESMVKRAITYFNLKNIPYQSGILCSGDQFVTDIAMLRKILQVEPNIIACEMEGMAIALTCQKFNTPFISIRGISDLIDHPQQQKEYAEVSHEIAEMTCSFVAGFLKME